MIRGDQARSGANRRVKYLSVSGNRPWLSKATDLRLTGGATASAAQVSYTENGVRQSAWVGFGDLAFVENPHQETINLLLNKKKSLEEEVKSLDSAIKALENLS